ncbi:MAG: Tat pathway signal protein, partial [FCB group bacterium]|nr:Tat pathway signal protein [FCB group bacterium]
MATETGSGELIWAYLVHLGYNMWCDHEHNLDPNGPSHIAAKDYLRFDEPLWRELLPRMRDAGVNMVVIDIGEGLRYESHPELAVKGSWPREKLEEELAVCREFGLEPIPKLNFSACHDVWLGPYSRMLSTKPYYDVVRDVITEVSDIFKTPRFFHLGMDEETA